MPRTLLSARSSVSSWNIHFLPTGGTASGRTEWEGGGKEGVGEGRGQGETVGGWGHLEGGVRGGVGPDRRGGNGRKGVEGGVKVREEK